MSGPAVKVLTPSRATVRNVSTDPATPATLLMVPEDSAMGALRTVDLLEKRTSH